MDRRKDKWMITKIFGMILVIFSCGGVGFKIAADHRREESFLRQFIDILNYMEWELKFRMTPLPDLCRKIATEYNNAIGNVFYDLAFEMDKQQNSDLSSCLTNVLNSKNIIPSISRTEFDRLGKYMGKFDLDGQLKGLDAVREDCKRNMDNLLANRENRLRSYQTLALCAGAALAILFI